MNHHRGHEPSIVGVLADDRRSSDELLPDAVNRRRLIEEVEQAFDARKLRRGFRRGLAEAVDGGRPR